MHADREECGAAGNEVVRVGAGGEGPTAGVQPVRASASGREAAAEVLVGLRAGVADGFL